MLDWNEPTQSVWRKLVCFYTRLLMTFYSISVWMANYRKTENGFISIVYFSLVFLIPHISWWIQMQKVLSNEFILQVLSSLQPNISWGWSKTLQTTRFNNFLGKSYSRGEETPKLCPLQVVLGCTETGLNFSIFSSGYEKKSKRFHMEVHYENGILYIPNWCVEYSIMRDGCSPPVMTFFNFPLYEKSTLF